MKFDSSKVSIASNLTFGSKNAKLNPINSESRRKLLEEKLRQWEARSDRLARVTNRAKHYETLEDLEDDLRLVLLENEDLKHLAIFGDPISNILYVYRIEYPMDDLPKNPYELNLL